MQPSYLNTISVRLIIAATHIGVVVLMVMLRFTGKKKNVEICKSAFFANAEILGSLKS